MAWARKTSSGRWQGQFRDERGRVRSYEHGTFRNEKDARDAAAEGERKVRRGEWINPELARTPFASLAHDYLEGASPFLKPKTVASYESLLRSRVLPEFGHRQVREIRPSDVVAWVGAMVGDGLSASRIRQAHVVLCLVLDAAVRDGYLMRNPAVGVKLPRLEHREAPFFEPNVVERIVDAMPPPTTS
jgi:hypothetical protein